MKTTTAILSALALAAVAAPAHASQADDVRACKAMLVDMGQAASVDELSFSSATRNRITLELDGGAKATCKFRRGKVSALVLDGVEYAATATKTARD